MGFTSADVPNYAVSTLASTLCLLSTSASAAEGNVVSYYLSLTSSILLAGLAVNQFGLNKSKALAATLAGQAKDSAVGQYNSFFKPKKEEQVAAEDKKVEVTAAPTSTPVVTAPAPRKR